VRRLSLLLILCLVPGLGGCSSSAKTGVSDTGGSCYDSTGAIATTAKSCTLATDCKQAVEPTCCAPALEVGLAKSSGCTFPAPSCVNTSCPANSDLPEQAEDGKGTVQGGAIGLDCVSGQCMTFVAVGQDAGCTGSTCSTDAGTGAGSDAGTPDTLSCTDWYRYPIPSSENVLINNVWNEQHAGTNPYRQCLTERNASEGVQYGWSWDWPACDTSTSFAAPEVVFGRKPWDGGLSTSSSLPKQVDAIQELLVDFGVEIVADACYNLNTTLWLTQSDTAPTDPDPQDVTTEVMVRFNDAGHLGGCCTLDGSVTLGGVPFQVWHQDGHADASGTTTYTWKMVIYESGTPLTDAQFDLALVLKDLVSRGLVQSTNAVQGVELITEVSGGSGHLWLDRFNVVVR
jgi:Glycosyl hydrolase family 12